MQHSTVIALLSALLSAILPPAVFAFTPPPSSITTPPIGVPTNAQPCTATDGYAPAYCAGGSGGTSLIMSCVGSQYVALNCWKVLEASSIFGGQPSCMDPGFGSASCTNPGATTTTPTTTTTISATISTVTPPPTGAACNGWAGYCANKEWLVTCYQGREVMSLSVCDQESATCNSFAPSSASCAPKSTTSPTVASDGPGIFGMGPSTGGLPAAPTDGPYQNGTTGGAPEAPSSTTGSGSGSGSESETGGASPSSSGPSTFTGAASGVEYTWLGVLMVSFAAVVAGAIVVL